MSAPGVPVADRLRRIASVWLARPLSETSDPARSASVAQRLGTLAAITDTAAVDALADALSGGAPMPPAVADRLTRGLGLPDGTLDPDTDFAPVEHDLVRRYLGARGVVDIRSCRGPLGRSALLMLVGLVDRYATGPAGAGAGT